MDDFRCPACGDLIDYCSGHGEIGDSAGADVLRAHDEGDHSTCNPAGCDEAPLVYDSEECNRFVADMRAAGFTVTDYHGRGFWTGPAVRADDAQDVIRATGVRVQWDTLGLGLIIYPVARGQRLPA